MKFNVLFRAFGRIDPISAHQPYFTRIIENGEPAVTAFMFTAVCGAAGKRYMGKKDITGKVYFKDVVRFAELMNAVLYHGEKLIQPENLVPMERKYPSLLGDSDKNRDVFMKDAEYQILYGLELETESDHSMPERVMVYDACEYEQQIRKITGARKRAQTKDTYREKKSRLKAEERCQNCFRYRI